MDPDNQPWSPKPYQPNEPSENTQKPVPNTFEQGEITWQHPLSETQVPNAQTSPFTRPHEQHQQAAPQPQQPAQHQWQQPVTPQPWNAGAGPNQPIAPTQQYGGQMPELPQLSHNSSGSPLSPQQKKQRFLAWIGVGLLVIIPAIILAITVWTKMSQDTANQKQAQANTAIAYNNDAIAALANGTITNDQVNGLDKTATFYTIFKKAAMQQIVQTKWDEYYTAQKDGQRGDQYTLYDTAIDYTSKKFSYNENSYSNLGLFLTRCIGDKQYNYNATKIATGASWDAASDSTDCELPTVAMHLNDGVNTGGLSETQANTFLSKLKGYGVVKVNNLTLVTNQGKQYIKIDLDITPQKSGSDYFGMQNLMNAFLATGLNASKQPYTFFGSGTEGAHIAYYFDPVSQLPVYSVAESTPGLTGAGTEQTTTSYSHRYIEYSFPQGVADQTLNDANPIGFSSWPVAN
ncbi:MAG TPA: hypothetical protein VJ843_03740 [Candidatus Saccharimonadales bacterium]|nr:hypothetical protein [Candidatus Saccharimonadales bacterium]